MTITLDLRTTYLRVDRSADGAGYVASAEFADGRVCRMACGAELEAVHAMSCALAGRTALRPFDDDLASLWEAVRAHDYVHKGMAFHAGELTVNALLALEAKRLSSRTRSSLQDTLTHFLAELDGIINLYEAAQKAGSTPAVREHPLLEVADRKLRVSSLSLSAHAELLGCDDLVRDNSRSSSLGSLGSLGLGFDPREFTSGERDKWAEDRAAAWIGEWQRYARLMRTNLQEIPRAKAWIEQWLKSQSVVQPLGRTAK